MAFPRSMAELKAGHWATATALPRCSRLCPDFYHNLGNYHHLQIKPKAHEVVNGVEKVTEEQLVMRRRGVMAPSGNRFEKTCPKERFSGGCCSHQEWVNARNSPPWDTAEPENSSGFGAQRYLLPHPGVQSCFPHEIGHWTPIL